MSRRRDRKLQAVLRVAIALTLLFEAAAFLLGAMLHLGVALPLPYVETGSMRYAFLEAASGALLLVASVMAILRKRNAWKIAVVANAVGVAVIAYVATGSVPSAQPSHHQQMLILLIATLLGLSIPHCRKSLENGRHVRRRRRIVQAL